ncbi:MAG: hypothetical protein ACTSVM_01035 [Candidatus Ranarchaeia archaeon]
MINQVFILRQETGELLYHRSYCQHKFDPALIGGFLSAMGNIATEQMVGDGGLESLRMKDERWVYFVDRGLYLIINADLAHPPNWLKHKLRYIAKEFFKRFDEEKIRNWKGNANLFRSFDKYLDSLLQDWEVAQQTTTDTKAMDILGLYENIIYRLLHTKMPRSKQEQFFGKVAEIAKEIFGPATNIRDQYGQLDLFNLILGEYDYHRFKVKLKRFYERIFAELTNTASKSAVTRMITKSLFPLFRFYYRNIDLYNIDQVVLPPIFEYMSR